MKHYKRIEKRLQQFASLLGGMDELGQQHTWPVQEIEARQKEHLFWVKNNDEDNTAGAFVLGNVVKDLIRDDIYDVEYVGHVKDSAVRRRIVDGGSISFEWVEDAALTPSQLAFKARFQSFLTRQAEQIEAGKKLKRQKLGEFFDGGSTGF